MFIVWEFGRYAARGLDGSYNACGSFSSGTCSSCVASHEKRSSARVDLLSLRLVFGLWKDQQKATPRPQAVAASTRGEQHDADVEEVEVCSAEP